jgi:2-C-methyl-D-erythritol 4-phosphate cytidylyltransferase
MITDVVNGLDSYPAIEVGSPHTEAVIEVTKDNLVEKIPPRENLYRGQTPQGFHLPVIREAHERARNEGFKDAHCDIELVLKYKSGGPVYLIRGSEYNIKITYPLDIFIADKILQTRSVLPPSVETDTLKEKISGKVIVVFGGTSGIGLEICRACEELGGYVYGLSRRTNVDVRDIDSISSALKKVYKKHNKIDHVVCSAAIVNVGTIEESNTDSILDQINTNLIGNIFVAKASIPYLIETKGSLLFFASSSYVRGRNKYSVYSASKAAMVNFVQGLGEELDSRNVRVNIINPDRTDTPMRQIAFSDRDRSSLLKPSTVAFAAVRVMASDTTCSVIDVRHDIH